MATGRLPENHPLLRLGRARRIEVRSEAPLCVHADGEFVCVPEDGIRQIEVEVVPRRLEWRSIRPHFTEAAKRKSPPTAGGL